jgi:hypothetical protein
MKRLIFGMFLVSFISSCAVYTKPGAVVVDTPNKIIVNPRVVMIPDYDVYIVDDPRIEVYQYKGRWYWFNNGRWYVAERWEGPWIILNGPPPFRIPPGQIRKMYIHERNAEKKFWKEMEKREKHHKDWD